MLWYDPNLYLEQSCQTVFPKIAKKFQKNAKISSLCLSNLEENITKLLQIGQKVAKICSIFWRKISTSGHSAILSNWGCWNFGLAWSRECSSVCANMIY